jgi:hypothetical protein
VGILKITVNAGPVTFAVDWEGDADDIEDVMTFIDNMAANNKIPPEQLTHSTLARLPETGIMEEPGAQQVQVMDNPLRGPELPAESAGSDLPICRRRADHRSGDGERGQGLHRPRGPHPPHQALSGASTVQVRVTECCPMSLLYNRYIHR